MWNLDLTLSCPQETYIKYQEIDRLKVKTWKGVACKNNWSWGKFPGSPVVRIQHFHCWGPGSIPSWATKIPQAMWHGQKKKVEMPKMALFITAKNWKQPTNLMSLKWWTDKPVHPYNEVLFSSANKWTSDSHNNMG